MIIGKCVYCGSTTYDPNRPDEPLHREHIIPESLGGVETLDFGSCRACEGRTSAFEGVIARAQLGPLRIHMGLPTKRPKERPTTLPITAVYQDGSKAELEVPVERYVPMVGMIGMDPPTMLGPPVGRNRKIFVHVFVHHEEWERRKEALRQWLGIPGMYTHARCASRPVFQAVIAKIAHCYTVSELGLDGFVPYLADKIANYEHSNPPSLDDYVGQMSEDVQPASDDLHTVHNEIVEKNGDRLVVTHVRLFSRLGFREYVAVSGHLPQSQPNPSGSGTSHV